MDYPSAIETGCTAYKFPTNDPQFGDSHIYGTTEIGDWELRAVIAGTVTVATDSARCPNCGRDYLWYCVDLHVWACGCVLLRIDPGNMLDDASITNPEDIADP